MLDADADIEKIFATMQTKQVMIKVRRKFFIKLLLSELKLTAKK